MLAHLSPSVFSIWDGIQPLDPLDPRFMEFLFISEEAPANPSALQMQAPHLGPAWRTRETESWLLNCGIIEWDDIPYGISCTCRLPAGFAKEAIDKVVQAWRDVSEDLVKQSINSMIGLRNNPRQFSFQARTHEPRMDDVLFEGAKVHRALE